MNLNLLIFLADASIVNGGAIDGFLRPLALHHALALLAVGILCAQLPRRSALHTLVAFLAALSVGMLLVLVGVALPAASIVTLALTAVLAIAVSVGQRLPWQAGFAIVAILGLVFANSLAAELAFKNLAYQASFLATFAVASLGLTWTGLALGFMALRSSSGAMLARMVGVVAVVLGIASLAAIA